MRTLAEDTSPEMEAVQIALWRKKTPAQKFNNLVSLRRMSKQLMLGNIRRLYPEANGAEISRQLLVRCFGQEIANRIFSNGELLVSRKEAAMLNEMQVLAMVVEHLEALKIPYYVGGSVASINYGEPRLTNDADLVIRIFLWHIPQFVKALEEDFVISAEALQEAVKHRHACNIIHIESAFKIDLFPISDDDEMEINAFGRRQLVDLEQAQVWMASAEDVVLAKLHWFRKGGKVSEKQWRDVLGVLKVQGENLDFAYLEQQAQRFRLADLLARAREEAGSIAA